MATWMIAQGAATELTATCCGQTMGRCVAGIGERWVALEPLFACGARLSLLHFIVKQVAPAELSALFSFGSARKQIAPPARRFAPSCSRTSLRSSYLLPIVFWCAPEARSCTPSFSQSSRSCLFHACGALCFLSFCIRARASDTSGAYTSLRSLME